MADTLTEGVDDAERLLDELRDVGIDYDDVTRVLEEEGVEKFSVSFRELKQGIEEKRNAFAAA
jgi:transaldolase